MAEQLKHLLDAQAVGRMAAALHRAWPRFRKQAFIRACLSGIGDLELSQRAWQIAEAMHEHLPLPFPDAARALIHSLQQEPALLPLQYMPHVFFVQKYGIDDFEASMRAQYEITQRFSAEWSIRAFLVKYPEETYARLLQWARDPNVHARRLVSEGTRPRLPWAPRLRAFQLDPRPVIALLNLLKDDPERYVQRSVANNLNDISKDHPDLAVEVCRQWLTGATPGREWIVRHALRGLVKAGHRGALQVLGVGGRPRVRIAKARLSSARVQRGGRLRFSFEIENVARSSQCLLVDYAVHFVKANGTTSRKVFKLRRLDLAVAARAQLAHSISFRNMTTRRHYPGRHRIEVLVNGMAYPLATFKVA